jgi:hypothetical protein
MKTILVNVVIISVLFVVVSCKPSKTIVSVSEKVRTDTIIHEKIITKFNAVHDTLTIDNPCDSTGILNTFYSKITLPQGKIIIKSYKGKIQATINIDSIRDVYESKYRNKESSDVKLFEKIVIKTQYPLWLIVLVFLESLIIFGYIYYRFIFIKL